MINNIGKIEKAKGFIVTIYKTHTSLGKLIEIKDNISLR